MDFIEIQILALCGRETEVVDFGKSVDLGDNVFMSKFKKGDLVKLKSGGPVMTIDTVIESDNLASCKWFHNGEIKTHLFNLDALEESQSSNSSGGIHIA